MATSGSETFTGTASGFASNGTPLRPQAIPGRLTPEYTIPSSPILKDNDTASSSYLALPNSSHRTSRASSFRLSRDLGSLRWNGESLDDTDFNEDDSMFGGEDQLEELTPENGEDAAADRADAEREETDELNSYSALSKRADFILASAKRKLNLLEGDLKGARHSLLLPKVSSHSPASSYSSARSMRLTPSTSPGEQENLVERPTRVVSSLPRHVRPTPAEQANRGHSRVFSDTSVPSPRGNAVKGSLGLEHVRNQQSLQIYPSERSLGPVIEGQVSTNYNDEENWNASRDDEATAKRPSATQALRSEADDVRDRLAAIQERLRLNAERRRSSGDSAIINQIRSLEMSLGQQEEVIGQMERSEDPERPNGHGSGGYDPRAEWQRILDRNDNQGDEYESSDEYDEETEFQSVLEQQELDEAEVDLDTPHEDRVDAFDYEHFILHSVLGASKRSRSPSEGSTSTARGLEDEKLDEYDASNPRQRLHHNESISSFATAQSNRDGDWSGSEGSGAAQEEREDDVDQSWPMPPSTNGSRHASTVFSDSSAPTPTRGSYHQPYKMNGIGGVGHRPASVIFSALMGPESNSQALPSLDDDDQTLIYGLSEALRMACLQLRRDAMRDQGGVNWRQRIEEARRVLAGEGDAPSS